MAISKGEDHKGCSLVTSAFGVGHELVNFFGNDTYNLVIVARTKESLDRAVADFSGYGVEVIPIIKDLFKPNAAFELYDQLASIAARLRGPYQAVYCAAKAYMLSFTEALVSEPGGTCVIIRALKPGTRYMDLFRKADMLSDSKENEAHPSP